MALITNAVKPLEALEVRPFLADVIFHEVKNHTSQASGKTSWACDMEILGPNTVQSVDGQEVIVAGQKMKSYASLDTEKEWGAGSIIRGLELAGFDFSKFTGNDSGAPALDPDQPEAVRGLNCRMMVSLRKEPLTELQADGSYAEIKGPDDKVIIKRAGWAPLAMNPFAAIKSAPVVTVDTGGM